MALSEIRVNTTKTRTGVGTITYTETGPVITGIATASNFKTGSTNVHSTGVELANINTGGSTATFGGPISGTTASFTGNVSIGGTLTYEDVTNIDSVGILTARAGIKVTGGNINIENASPRIDLTDTGANPDFAITNTDGNYDVTDLTNSATRFRITADGKFGFNTSTPYAYDTTATTFEVKGSVSSAADTEVVRFRGGSDADGGTAVLRLTNNNDRGLVVKGGRESTASEFAEFGVSSFNGTYTRVLKLNASGSVGIGTDSPSYRLQVHNSGGNLLRLLSGHEDTYDLRYVYQNSEANIWSYGSTDLTFGTRYNKKLHLVTNGPGKRLTIDGSGYVGINNTAPAYPLEVFGDGGISAAASTNSTSGQLSIVGKNSGGSVSAISRIKSEPSGSTNTSQMVFQTRNSSASMVEAMRITSAGKVLIGTTTPQGNANADDLVVATSATTGITIRSGTGNSGNIFFADGTSGGDEYRGWVTYNHGNENLNFGVNAGERLILNQYATLTLESGSQGSNSKPGIELKSTGYTGNITRLFQDSPNASSILETTERVLVIDIDSQNQVNGSHLQIHIDNSEQFRFDPSSITYQKQNTRGTLLAPLDYHNNTNHYIDLTQWRVSDNWNILEVFGTVNPNSSGSGAYADPVHMYIYRGTGWDQANTAIAHWVYCASVAPPSRHAFPSGTGYAGNSGISAVWYTGSSVRGNKSSTSTDYVRLQIPNANGSNNFVKTFRVMRRY